MVIGGAAALALALEVRAAITGRNRRERGVLIAIVALAWLARTIL